MQLFLKELLKNRWGCSSSMFDDQKGNTDYKHTNSCFDLKIGHSEKNIPASTPNIIVCVILCSLHGKFLVLCSWAILLLLVVGLICVSMICVAHAHVSTNLCAQSA